MAHRLVVHLNKDEYDVRIDRANPVYGNPFSHKEDSKAQIIVATRAESIAYHRAWIKGLRKWPGLRDPPSREQIIRDLRGKRLGCWCGKDKSCHGDVLAEIANGEDQPELEF